MKPVRHTKDQPVLTIGELCEALADGELAARQEDGYYTFTVRDFHRYADEAALKEMLFLFDDVVLTPAALVR